MGATHWNSNLMCSIDLETSGLDPQKHDILQIAIVPLNADLEPHSTLPFFYMEMQPMKKEEDVEPSAMRTNKLDWHNLRDTAMDPWKIFELFEEWRESLKLPLGKKIIPLAHNYTFEYKFLLDWMGPAAMEDFFFQYRDTMALANSMNDMADMVNMNCPFPKTNLAYLCSQLHVENYKPHDALQDAIATAECYRQMVKRYKIFN